MRDGMPIIATVAHGKIAVNSLGLNQWLVTEQPGLQAWGVVFRLLCVGILAVPGALWRRALGRKRTALQSTRRFVAYGFPVAIWTLPGEWRVVRTLADLQQIIADGGEVEPSKDED